MIINDPDNDDELINKIAERLHAFDKPFLMVVDMGDHILKVLGNTDEFEDGHLNMAKALEAIAYNLRVKNEN